MENQTQEKKNTNLAVMITGFLGHDADYFDRTCPNCKGMYSSFDIVSCPKCSAELVHLTTSKGKPFSISEVTIYPMLGAQEAKDAKIIEGKKNGMPITWRIKEFSFMQDGVLSPPPLYHQMKKGAMVKFTIINHQLIPSWFTTKSGAPRVELLAQIYPQYGDSVKVLAAPKVQEAMVSYPANPDGSPTPINVSGGTAEEKIAVMEAEIARLQAANTAATSPTPPTPDTSATTTATTTNESEPVDPFEMAS